jgi:hypothetical protein
MRRVAKDEGVELIDLQKIYLEHAEKLNQPVDALMLDGMHPNEVGHRLEADLLRDRILAIAKRDGLAIE